MQLGTRNYQLTPAVFALVFMNLIPLIGVMKFGWNAGTIIFLYWLENVVIGILNIPKILACTGAELQPQENRRGRGTGFYAAFFSFHYGMFCFGHYAFLQSAFPEVPGFGEIFGALTNSVLIWSLFGLAMSHLISMFVNFYGRKEYLGRSPSKQMFMPYSRIAMLHIVIILSGFLAVSVGQGLAMLVILVALKIAVDLAAHLVEHAKTQDPLDKSTV